MDKILVSVSCPPQNESLAKLKEAVTHKSEIPTPALFLCLMTSTFDFLSPKIKRFPGLVVENSCVKFGDRSCRDI